MLRGATTQRPKLPVKTLYFQFAHELAQAMRSGWIIVKTFVSKG